jgi:hypothetical protein
VTGADDDDEGSDDLADRLEAIVADLDERSFALLREASANGRARPAEDKRLTQARRAIEKAINLLRHRDRDALSED